MTEPIYTVTRGAVTHQGTAADFAAWGLPLPCACGADAVVRLDGKPMCRACYANHNFEDEQ